MHKADARQSCAGCHTSAQQKPECAGCHANRKKGIGGTEACVTCHATPPADLQKTEAELMPIFYTHPAYKDSSH